MAVWLIYCNLYVKHFLITCLELDDRQFAIRPSIQCRAKSSSWFQWCKLRDALLTLPEGKLEEKDDLTFSSVPYNPFAVRAQKQH